MLAVKENPDDLAKQALMRRSEHVSRGEQMQLTWQAHKQETDRLKESLRGLNDNIEEAIAQEESSSREAASRRRAEAHHRDDVVHLREIGVRGVRADGREDRPERATDPARTPRSTRSSRATGSRTTSSGSRRRAGNASADAQLIELKQKMGMLPRAAPTPTGSSAAGARRQAEEIPKRKRFTTRRTTLSERWCTEAAQARADRHRHHPHVPAPVDAGSDSRCLSPPVHRDHPLALPRRGKRPSRRAAAVPEQLAFFLAVAGTIVALLGLFALLVPPVVEQTRL